jgi:flagellar basal-body rod modification protein FlgD
MANSDMLGSLGNTSRYTKYEDTLVRENKGDNLGKEDFLKLLVAQLTQQDPTNPMQDTEFIAQLATYSGLEQQMNMNKNLETLIAGNNANTAASAVSLIGTVVGYTGEDGSLKTGLVSFLDIVDGEVNLYLADGSYVPFKNVEQVGLPAYKAPDPEEDPDDPDPDNPDPDAPDPDAPEGGE